MGALEDLSFQAIAISPLWRRGGPQHLLSRGSVPASVHGPGAPGAAAASAGRARPERRGPRDPLASRGRDACVPRPRRKAVALAAAAVAPVAVETEAAGVASSARLVQAWAHGISWHPS